MAWWQHCRQHVGSLNETTNSSGWQVRDPPPRPPRPWPYGRGLDCTHVGLVTDTWISAAERVRGKSHDPDRGADCALHARGTAHRRRGVTHKPLRPRACSPMAHPNPCLVTLEVANRETSRMPPELHGEYTESTQCTLRANTVLLWWFRPQAYPSPNTGCRAKTCCRRVNHERRCSSLWVTQRRPLGRRGRSS